jgi:hypothetical protein
LLAGEAASIGSGDEEMKAVEIARAGEDAIPPAQRFAGDLARDEVGEGIDSLARASAEEGFRAEMKFEFDESVGGDRDEQEIGEEPEEDFRGKGGREKSELRTPKFEGFVR